MHCTGALATVFTPADRECVFSFVSYYSHHISDSYKKLMIMWNKLVVIL